MIRATSVFVDGVEKLGFILYGLWPVASRVGEPDFEDLASDAVAIRGFHLVGESWDIVGVECGFEDDSLYRGAVSNIEPWFDVLLACGAHVAWLGSEGLPFADPPDLFTTEWMEGGVLAAKTSDGRMVTGISSEGFTPLSGGEMTALEQVARVAYRLAGHDKADR